MSARTLAGGATFKSETVEWVNLVLSSVYSQGPTTSQCTLFLITVIVPLDFCLLQGLSVSTSAFLYFSHNGLSDPLKIVTSLVKIL